MRTLGSIFVVIQILFLVAYIVTYVRRESKWKFICSLGIVACSLVLIAVAIFLEHTALWVCELLMLLKYIGKTYDNYQTI